MLSAHLRLSLSDDCYQPNGKMIFFRALCAGGFAFHSYHDYNKGRFSRIRIEQTLTAQVARDGSLSGKSNR